MENNNKKKKNNNNNSSNSLDCGRWPQTKTVWDLIDFKRRLDGSNVLNDDRLVTETYWR